MIDAHRSHCWLCRRPLTWRADGGDYLFARHAAPARWAHSSCGRAIYGVRNPPRLSGARAARVPAIAVARVRARARRWPLAAIRPSETRAPVVVANAQAAWGPLFGGAAR